MDRATGSSDVEYVRAAWIFSSITPLVAGFLALAVVVAFAEGATSHSTGSPSLQYAAIAVAVAGTALVSGVTVLTSFVRAAELTPRGATFRIGTRRVAVRWEELVPPQGPFLLAMTFRYRRDGKVQERDTLVVTRRLARAILSYPSCPRFNLPEPIWASLRMRPPSRSQ